MNIEGLSKAFAALEIEQGRVFGIEEYGRDAIFSSHAIAKLWLSIPDFDIEDTFEGWSFDAKGRIPEPKVPAVPIKYTPEEEERRKAFWESFDKGGPFHFRPVRIPFKL